MWARSSTAQSSTRVVIGVFLQCSQLYGLLTWCILSVGRHSRRRLVWGKLSRAGTKVLPIHVLSLHYLTLDTPPRCPSIIPWWEGRADGDLWLRMFFVPLCIWCLFWHIFRLNRPTVTAGSPQSFLPMQLWSSRSSYWASTKTDPGFPGVDFVLCFLTGSLFLLFNPLFLQLASFPSLVSSTYMYSHYRNLLYVTLYTMHITRHIFWVLNPLNSRLCESKRLSSTERRQIESRCLFQERGRVHRVQESSELLEFGHR